MNLNDYQQKALTTLTAKHAFGDITPELMALLLGLVGESGEVAEKFKKVIRDDMGKMDEDKKRELAKELGDVLWYIASLSHVLGTDLETIARSNIEKLTSRQQRGVLGGSGDNR